MKIRTILVVLFVILIPFILNLWNGYLKPAQSGKFKELDCTTISNSLNPYVNDIIHIAQNHGNKSSSGAVEGYKITRCTIKEKLPQVFNIVGSMFLQLEVTRPNQLIVKMSNTVGF